MLFRFDFGLVLLVLLFSWGWISKIISGVASLEGPFTSIRLKSAEYVVTLGYTEESLIVVLTTNMMKLN